MKWLILAWWVSSRFNWINKCILPINWKSIINHNISFLHSLWVKNIWIVLSKKTLETINFIDDSLNINISYFIQDKSYWVLSAIDSAKDFIDDDTIVICWDNYIDLDIKELIIQKHKYDIVISWIEKYWLEARRFCVYHDGKYIEKPDYLKENKKYLCYCWPIILDQNYFSKSINIVESNRWEREISELFNKSKTKIIKVKWKFFDIWDPISYAKSVLELNTYKWKN